MDTIGNRLKGLRLERDITQEELANILNTKYNASINKGMISKWESDKSEPRLDYVRNMAEFYNVSVDYIICLTDNPKSKNTLKKEIDEMINKSGIRTIAAHFEGEEFTEEDKEDIEKFINFVISKKKK